MVGWERDLFRALRCMVAEMSRLLGSNALLLCLDTPSAKKQEAKHMMCVLIDSEGELRAFGDL